MDPQQSALPLQLHSNSFAMGPGQVPKLRVEEGGRGGEGTARAAGGQEAQVHQPNVTFPSGGVSSRWSPGESLQWPRGTRVDRGAKGRLDVKSGSCSLLTICRSGIMFPWMNSRTADFKQSGNTIFIIFGLKKKKKKMKTCERTNIIDTIPTPAICAQGVLTSGLSNSALCDICSLSVCTYNNTTVTFQSR